MSEIVVLLIVFHSKYEDNLKSLRPTIYTLASRFYFLSHRGLIYAPYEHYQVASQFAESFLEIAV